MEDRGYGIGHPPSVVSRLASSPLNEDKIPFSFLYEGFLFDSWELRENCLTACTNNGDDGRQTH